MYTKDVLAISEAIAILILIGIVLMMAMVIGIFVCSFKKNRKPLLQQKGADATTIIEFQVEPASKIFLRHLKGNVKDFECYWTALAKWLVVGVGFDLSSYFLGV